jgi:hypothetical protein
MSMIEIALAAALEAWVLAGAAAQSRDSRILIVIPDLLPFAHDATVSPNEADALREMVGSGLLGREARAKEGWSL